MAADFGFIPNEQPGSYFISYNLDSRKHDDEIVEKML